MLIGGAGDDTFVFRARLDDDGALGGKARGGGHASFAKITDFAPGEDVIKFDHNVFLGLDPGALGDAVFYAGKGARAGHDQDDRIVCDTKSGKLWFDADGAGGKDAILFAKVAGAPDLGHTDFLVL